jgi:hypothetical protein
MMMNVVEEMVSELISAWAVVLDYVRGEPPRLPYFF